MKENDAENLIRQLLADSMKEHGFEAVREASFERRHSDRVETVTFATYLDRTQSVRISAAVSISFPEVNEILGYSADTDGSSTVSMPLHLLHRSGKYQDWLVDDRTDPEALKRDILEQVSAYALPFLEKYSSLSAVRCSLEPNDPTEWVVLDPQERLATLIAIEWVQGARETALQRLEQGLKEAENKPPKKRYWLERLRRRLGHGA